MAKGRAATFRDRYETLLEAQSEMGLGFLILEEGRLVYANEACSQITGYYSLEDLNTLTSIFDLVVQEERDMLLERMRRRLSSQKIVEHYESTIVHKSGRRVEVEIAVKPLKADDRTQLVVLLRDISERKRAEEALRRSKVRNEAILNASPDLVFLFSRAGVFLDFKAVGKESMLYAPPEEIIGKKLSDLMPAEIADTALHYIARALDTSEMQVYEYQLSVPDGVRDFEARLVKSGANEVLGVVRDITERKQSEELLRQQSAAMTTSVDGIAILDQNATYIYVNEAHAEIYGYDDPEELLGKTWEALYDEREHRRIERDVMPAFLENGRWCGELIGKKRDGSTFPQEVSLTMIEEGGFVCVVRDITERKRAEEELGFRKALLEAQSEASIDGILVVSGDGKMISFNRRFVEMWGIPEEVMATGASEAALQSVVDKLVDPQEFLQRVAYLYEHPDEESREEMSLMDGRTFQRYSVAVRSAGGAYYRRVRVWYFRDITERKRTEDALRQQNEYLSALHGTALALMDRLELASLLEAIITRAGALMETPHGYVYLLKPGETELEMQVGVGIYEEYIGYRLKPGEGLSGRVLRSGQPLVVEDYRAWQGKSPKFTHDAFHAMVGVPLKSGTEVVGVIGLAYLEEGRTFGDDELALLSRFAELASIALDNARLYTSAQQELAERKRTEEALRESEEKYRTLVEAVQEGIGFVDAEERITYCNQAYAAIFELTPQELIGRSLFEFLDEEQRQKALEQTALRKNNVRSSYEITITTRDGKRKDLSASGAPIINAHGDFQGAVHAIIDITERKRAEDALRQSEERYRAVIERTTDGIFLGDFETKRILESNTALQDMLGYTSEELRGMSLYDVIAEDRESIDCNSQRILEEKSFLIGERKYRRKDGSLVNVEASATLIPYGGKEASCCIARDITARKALEERLEYQAFHDSLTNLPNRALFINRLEHALARAKRQRGEVAVLFMDLDNFKVVNDSLGHEVGDRLLVAVAERLKACLRPADTMARLSGDELTVLLEDVEDLSYTTRVAERIINELRAPFAVGGREVFVTASMGIAHSDSAQDHPDDLLRNADLAMYRAKSRGKAHYEVFDLSMSTSALERLELGNDLRRALERDEFKVCYQPKMLLETGKILGMEALVRWEHPQRGLLSPSEFIPIAEETGLIFPIGQRVLEEACLQARAWQEQYSSDTPLVMCVNLSARQFQQPNLADNIARVLQVTELDPRCLELEITESVVMEDVQSTINTLRELKDLGVWVAIDDFGTGYSSFSYLKRFPVSSLKIDRSFVDRLGKDPEDAVLVSGIIALAHTLGMQVIAEGVETAEQLALLQGFGCDLAQGNYFSKPLTSEAASELLATAPR